MTRFWPAFPALVSVALLAAGPIEAARPRYGGTLRVQTAGALRAFEPAAPLPLESAGARHVVPLVFETLIGVGQDGGLEPRLATAWEPEGARWRIRFRQGVRLHDGSELPTALVIAQLRATHSDWQISESADGILIEAGRTTDVPWMLADERDAIVTRAATGELLGTGPFRVERVTPARVALRAHDDYWGGRAFLDAIQVDLGRPAAAQLADLEAGRADVVDIAAIDERRLVQRGLRVVASRPLESFALVFEAHRATASTDAARRTFAAAIDRSAIARVLLRDRAEPAESIVPRWLSGYDAGVLARPARPLPRSAIAALPADQRSWTLRVPAADALARAIAERVAVDAGQAGFTIAVQAPAGVAPRADLRLVRLPMQPSTPDRVLASVMAALTPRTLAYVSREPAPAAGAALEDVLRVERALVARDVIVPVVHVPDVYGLGARVDSWKGPAVLPTGEWNFANIWLTPEAP